MNCLGFYLGFQMSQTKSLYLFPFMIESPRENMFFWKTKETPYTSNSIITTDPSITLILRIIVLWFLKKLKKKKIKNLKLKGLWTFSAELLPGKNQLSTTFLFIERF